MILNNNHIVFAGSFYPEDPFNPGTTTGFLANNTLNQSFVSSTSLPILNGLIYVPVASEGNNTSFGTFDNSYFEILPFSIKYIGPLRRLFNVKIQVSLNIPFAVVTNNFYVSTYTNSITSTDEFGSGMTYLSEDFVLDSLSYLESGQLITPYYITDATNALQVQTYRVTIQITEVG